MSTLSVLIVEEKNNNTTLVHPLLPLGYEIETANTGVEALERLEKKGFSLMLLDLDRPKGDSLAILCQVVERHPEVKVILISAHGTVEQAVEAMKSGAVDFLQKPFAHETLRRIVTDVLDQNKVKAAQNSAYEAHLKLIRQSIEAHHLEAALEHARQAIGIDISRPEAFNLLGVLYEINNDHEEAMKHYRVAVDLDPTYRLAWQNLNRPAEAGRNRARLDLHF